jgi:hypothetical protein
VFSTSHTAVALGIRGISLIVKLLFRGRAGPPFAKGSTYSKAWG